MVSLTLGLIFGLETSMGLLLITCIAKFQIIAENKAANTNAIFKDTVCSIKISIGSRFMMPTATAMPPVITPAKLHKPDQTTAACGGNDRV